MFVTFCDYWYHRQECSWSYKGLTTDIKVGEQFIKIRSVVREAHLLTLIDAVSPYNGVWTRDSSPPQSDRDQFHVVELAPSQDLHHIVWLYQECGVPRGSCKLWGGKEATVSTFSSIFVFFFQTTTCFCTFISGEIKQCLRTSLEFLFIYKITLLFVSCLGNYRNLGSNG